jgi:hypothetical protein
VDNRELDSNVEGDQAGVYHKIVMEHMLDQAPVCIVPSVHLHCRSARGRGRTHVPHRPFSLSHSPPFSHFLSLSRARAHTHRHTVAHQLPHIHAHIHTHESAQKERESEEDEREE